MSKLSYQVKCEECNKYFTTDTLRKRFCDKCGIKKYGKSYNPKGVWIKKGKNDSKL